MKKYLFFIFSVFALSINGFSQDCDNLINTSIDHITGKLDAACTDNITLSDSAGYQLTIASAMRNNQLLITFTITGSSSWCFDKYGIIYFIFKDKSQSSYHNLNEFNCDGLSELKINANTSLANQASNDQELKALTGRTIRTIRLKTMHSLVHFDMSQKDSDLFDKQLTCLWQFQTGTGR